MMPILYQIAAVLLLVLGGCGSMPDDVVREAVRGTADSAAVDEREPLLEVYLIGDAGKPKPGGDPVLLAAEHMASENPARTLVVFLGDNLYPEGVPEEPGPRRVEAERILQAQLNVSLKAGARGVFVPGNHDWDHSGPAGWAETMVQQEYIAAHGAGRVELIPTDGCPGPAVRDYEGGLRLVALDTQWWLHPYDKPRPPPDVCTAVTDSAVITQVRKVLREANGRPVLVVAHHPLISGGTHGVFPLLPTRFAPIPRFSSQDLGHPRYRHMRRVLESAFAETPPLVFAAGHDHNLQLLQGIGAHYQIVSGTGFYGRTGRVRTLPSTIYRNRASGFIRLAILAGGAVRLDAFTVDADARATRDFSRMLSPGDSARAASAPRRAEGGR